MNVYYESKDGDLNELYHYGVLGMKWGVRRANRLSAKAEKQRAKADKQYGKVQKTATSLFGSGHKLLKRAVKAGAASQKAMRYTMQADKVRAKHEAKYQKQVAKNEKRLQNATKKGAPKEKIAAMSAKGKELVDTYASLSTKRVKSDTENITKLNDRIYKTLEQLDRQVQMENRLYG